jgi:heme-degrading monooxygenase HmoA
MILEVADFRIKTDNTADFETAMEELRLVIAASPGYLGHTLQRSQETAGRYLLLVRWSSLEAHTKGFRGSVAFETWRNRLGSHRDGALVEHFETVLLNDWTFAPSNG